ncbi:hypothetical protein CEP50_03915 [Actinopolyspora mortivallis]|uniref:DUF3558 domain-containing protein n=1 Tax=Actinopolyspora mortivallis TaxID=33906 RepID=A0A2T0H012_ACTMO|nr:hypothetical protein CEP50_03915 [Actinopolyspora mortivallis]
MASCAVGDPSEGVKDGSGGATADSSETPSGDPFAVPRALDLSAVSDPCELLTQQQVQRLGAGRSQADGKSPWGEDQCRWRNQRMNFSIAPDTTQPEGLEFAAFTNTEDGKPTHEVNGYPAVSPKATDLTCTTFVGVSKRDVVSVSYTVGTDGRNDPRYSEPCAMSDRIAGMVLDNLPAE